jgi:tetrahydromethanopterin S-methyltransferase subunit G
MKVAKKKKVEQVVTMEGIARLITDSHDSLARTVAKGFEAVDKRFEEVDKKFEAMDEKFEKKFEDMDEKFEKKVDYLTDTMHQRFDTLSNRIDDITLNRATQDEFHILTQRVDRVERQVGIKK